MSYESELAGLREALELPIVGQPHRATDLDRLRQLIEIYTNEASQILAELGARKETRDPRS